LYVGSLVCQKKFLWNLSMEGMESRTLLQPNLSQLAVATVVAAVTAAAAAM
jgi:hypothetical protein